MTFEEYEREVEWCYNVNPTYRWGQCYFNVLHYYHPELANDIRTGPLDPFFLDYAPYEFLTWVARELRVKRIVV